MRMRYQQDVVHREKQKARSRVRKAVIQGVLNREPCEVCGSESETEAHHADYQQPLLVTWLCRPCHENKHGGPGCHG